MDFAFDGGCGLKVTASAALVVVLDVSGTASLCGVAHTSTAMVEATGVTGFEASLLAESILFGKILVCCFDCSVPLV